MTAHDELEKELRQWRKQREAEERALNNALLGGCSAQIAGLAMVSILILGTFIVLTIVSALFK